MVLCVMLFVARLSVLKVTVSGGIRTKSSEAWMFLEARQVDFLVKL